MYLPVDKNVFGYAPTRHIYFEECILDFATVEVV